MVREGIRVSSVRPDYLIHIQIDIHYHGSEEANRRSDGKDSHIDTRSIDVNDPLSGPPGTSWPLRVMETRFDLNDHNSIHLSSMSE